LETLMLLALAVAVALETGSTPQAPLPRGWREPTQAEIAEALPTWRELGAQTYREPDDPPYKDPVFAFEADLDGDGRQDRAAILLNPRRGRIGVFALRAAAGRYEAIEAFKGDASELHTFSIYPASPGFHEDVCARGIGDDSRPCRRGATAQWTGIAFGTVEASEAVAFWNGRRFDIIWTSD
jgi:hypothetical protein